MEAFILAAGLGSRLRPVTDCTPKPLILINGKPIVVYWIEKLQKLGFKRVLINCHHLKQQMIATLGDGSQFGIKILWQCEQQLLNTGGSVVKACRTLATDKLLLINADIYCDIDLDLLQKKADSSCLCLVPALQHNSSKDFNERAGYVSLFNNSDTAYTYAGVAHLDCQDILSFQPESERFPLVQWFYDQLKQKLLAAYIHRGYWYDIGTAESLQNAQHHATQ